MGGAGWYDVWTLVSATCFLFSLHILFHAALAQHGCLDHCTHTYFFILAQAFSNEVSFLSRYSFANANVLLYFTLTDSICQVFMYSKWSFNIKSHTQSNFSQTQSPSIT